MDIKRTILYALFIGIAYFLWLDWEHDYPRTIDSAHTEAVPAPISTSGEPVGPAKSSQDSASGSVPVSPMPQTASVQTPISVKTDVLSLSIDPVQGDIVDTQLLTYPVSTTNDTPFSLLYTSSDSIYHANSNILVPQGKTVEPMAIQLHSDKSQYTLMPNQKDLLVALTGKTNEGVKITKEFVFTRGSYVVQVRYRIANEGSTPWVGYINTQLVRNQPADTSAGMFQMNAYTGASYSQPGQHRYEKVSFKDMAKRNLQVDAEGGWIAMQQHYFLTAWIPDLHSQNRFYTRVNDNNAYTIGSVSHPFHIAPQSQETITNQLYVGPELPAVLKTLSPGLDMTVDYGWLWFLSSLLLSCIEFINKFVGNWGWSIVIVTLLIKLAFYRLSESSYKSMANMRRVQPKLEALRDRYGDDKAKMSQATMALYKEERINPLGGCLPILVQIPVFIALYWALLESVVFRQAPFILWIHDLSMPDMYHILPIIMGITMLIQQKLNPPPPDPTQAKIMMFLPVLFTGLFWNFPSGLVLYWVVNNTVSVLQQWIIMRKYGDVRPRKKTAAIQGA